MLVARYIVNGLVATAVHFAILTFNVELLHMASAGMANFVAAICAISVSFLGSRHFVFRAAHAPMIRQAIFFVILYTLIAVGHGLILYLWTDRAGMDYRLGFLVATCFQVACSFFGNKLWVFKP